MPGHISDALYVINVMFRDLEVFMNYTCRLLIASRYCIAIISTAVVLLVLFRYTVVVSDRALLNDAHIDSVITWTKVASYVEKHWTNIHDKGYFTTVMITSSYYVCMHRWKT